VVSYPAGIDEIAESDLLMELAKRAWARARGRCDYCQRLPEEEPCRFPERHRQVLPPCGATLIAGERLRQVTQEAWTPDHDDHHNRGELAMAAACYAAPEALYKCLALPEGGAQFSDPWPWDEEDDKRPRYSPYGPLLYNAADTVVRIEVLTKAGALVAAELDRLRRVRVRELAEEADRLVDPECTSCGHAQSAHDAEHLGNLCAGFVDDGPKGGKA